MIINLELIFSDIELVDKRLDSAKKRLKADLKNKQEILRKELLATQKNISEECKTLIYPYRQKKYFKILYKENKKLLCVI